MQSYLDRNLIFAVARLYSDAYAGTGMSADEIWEECICDSLGDMNIFAGVETIGEFFDLALPESALRQARPNHLLRREDRRRVKRVGHRVKVVVPK